jgi:hypothetical protein
MTDHEHVWVRCPTCDNGDRICEKRACRAHREQTDEEIEQSELDEMDVDWGPA